MKEKARKEVPEVEEYSAVMKARFPSFGNASVYQIPEQTKLFHSRQTTVSVFPKAMILSKHKAREFNLQR